MKDSEWCGNECRIRMAADREGGRGNMFHIYKNIICIHCPAARPRPHQMYRVVKHQNYNGTYENR
jgi:hypothetical protein